MDQSKGHSGKTIAGTDINQVKEQNAQSGLSYNEAKAFIAKNMGGHGTEIFSDTDSLAIRQELQKDGKKN
ncbi:hypothetical protein GCM10011391_04840 [Pullulanibacillus camelliae]|uniref:Gamma-type small acid-soluble spore protein n=1 Tax=Pullulanibacillus camelliae TaxID=1707096 RepID=A0A8J2YES7_9BACL|nr:gamma-type small acid-soluble spore protein [Pullulanibacillus camelliae]GGE29335.1 hypothetical protein GCM10011391_04840 [Pullulanibacillus camelliae]